MLAKFLVFLCNVSPTLRRMLWRWWYSKLARQIHSERWTFMNYGYAPEKLDPLATRVDDVDEPDRLCIQLYAHVASATVLAGKEVLEVGSGRGGGASYIARYLGPTKVTGVDFSPRAVEFARKRHKAVPNLNFQAGDAENLPFGDGSFDAVINVESSHCYGDIRHFFSEAHRVLRPGGSFLYADFREAREIPALESMLKESPWEQIASEEITPDVLRALALDDRRKRELIAALVPERLRAMFGEFAALTGGKVYEAFRAGELKYWRFAFRKRDA